MSLNLIFAFAGGRRQKRIGFLRVDVFTYERVSYESAVTENPVEFGGVVTDHVYNRPTRLRVRGTVDAARRGAAFQSLKLMHESRLPTFVSTGLQVFPLMVMSRLDIDRGETNASPLEFSAEFTEITFALSQLAVDVQSAAEGAQDTVASAVSAGTKVAQDVSASVAEAAGSAAEAAGGLGGGGSILSKVFR